MFKCKIKNYLNIRTNVITLSFIIIALFLIVILLQLQLIISDPVLKEALTIIVVAVIISLIYELFLRGHFISQIEELMKRKLGPEGLECAYENRPVAELVKLFSNAREIKILGTSLSYWGALPGLIQSLQKSLDSGCSIEFLSLNPNLSVNPINDTLDPKSYSYAKYRGDDLRDESFVQKIQDSNREIYNSLNGRGEFSFKLYNRTPTVVMIIVDCDIFVTFLLIGLKGRETIHFKIKRYSDLGRIFENHYREILASSLSYRP